MRVDLPFPACEFAQQGIDLGPAIESEFADMHPNSPPEKSGGCRCRFDVGMSIGHAALPSASVATTSLVETSSSTA